MFTVYRIHYSSSTLLLSLWILLDRGPPVACIQTVAGIFAIAGGPAVTGFPAVDDVLAVASFPAGFVE